MERSGTEISSVGKYSLQQEKINGNKKVYLEALRMIAAWLIIFNHTGAHGFFFFAQQRNSRFFWLYLFLSIADKVAVPVFWMISGAVLIEKEESVSEVLRKRVLRMAAVIIIFSFMNYIYDIYENNLFFSFSDFGRKIYSSNMGSTYWFFYSYLGFLLMLPFLRKMYNNLKNDCFIYMIILWIIFQGMLPIFQFIVWKGEYVFNREFTIPIVTSVNIIYSGIGYFLEKRLNKEFYHKKYIILLLAASFICIFICCLMTFFFAGGSDKRFEESYSQTFFNTLILIPALTLFLAVKWFFMKIKIPNTVNKIIIWIGNLTFTLLLIEGVIRDEILGLFYVFSKNMSEFIACILWVTVVFIIGLFVSALLKKIPLFRNIL